MHAALIASVFYMPAIINVIDLVDLRGNFVIELFNIFESNLL